MVLSVVLVDGYKASLHRGLCDILRKSASTYGESIEANESFHMNSLEFSCLLAVVALVAGFLGTLTGLGGVRAQNLVFVQQRAEIAAEEVRRGHDRTESSEAEAVWVSRSNVPK